MATYRLPITLQEYQTLEIYYFQLTMFTDTGEYKRLNTLQQHGVTQELVYISIVLGILARIFGDHTRNQRPVMAWPVETDDPMNAKAYRFSSGKVASKALGCNQSHITAVCKGHEDRYINNKEKSSDNRHATGGWSFCYEELYEDNVVHYNMMTGKFE